LSEPKPRIGLTTYRQRGQTGVWDTEFAMIPAFYIEGVTRAEGLAVMIPPQTVSMEDAKEILSGVDALMICGGRDVESARYGQAPHEKAEEPDRLRDALEDQLLNAAVEMKLPFLGICRGAQMLNVNRGGTLTQHLPDPQSPAQVFPLVPARRLGVALQPEDIQKHSRQPQPQQDPPVPAPYRPHRPPPGAWASTQGSSSGACSRTGHPAGSSRRRIHTRYDRCAHTFMSAICIAATVIFWL
jgi:gamma-glutamyl-gamma-aminobutyrate hydrolase PuuD